MSAAVPRVGAAHDHLLCYGASAMQEHRRRRRALHLATRRSQRGQIQFFNRLLALMMRFRCPCGCEIVLREPEEGMEATCAACRRTFRVYRTDEGRLKVKLARKGDEPLVGPAKLELDMGEPGHSEETTWDESLVEIDEQQRGCLRRLLRALGLVRG